MLSVAFCASVVALGSLSAMTAFGYDDPADDFYMAHYGQQISTMMFVADNDGQHPDWSRLVQVEPQAQHGFLANQGNYYQFFSYNPQDYTGMDYFHYYYHVVWPDPNPGDTATATVYIADIGTDDAQNAGNGCPTRMPNSGPCSAVRVTKCWSPGERHQWQYVAQRTGLCACGSRRINTH